MSRLFSLLTNTEKNNLKKWSYSVDDPSITTKLLSPFWNYVVDWVPDIVAPNVLSLSGLLLLVYSFYISYTHFKAFPRLIPLIASILIFAYQTLDAIDGKHARNTKNSSPLGELFDHACDSVGMIFIVLTVSHVFGINDATTLFYITQAGGMLFLLEHLKAFQSKQVVFSKWTGPGELLMLCIFALLVQTVTKTQIKFSQDGLFLQWIIPGVYWATYAYVLYKVWESYAARNLYSVSKPIESNTLDDGISHIYATEAGLVFCLFMRHINGMLLWFGLFSEWTIVDVLAHSVAMSVVTSDLIVAKMAKRELHPIIVLGSMLTMFNHNLLIFILVAVYFLKTFYEICDSMNIALFSPSKNIYISGVFDLLHYGHMKHFEIASKYGNRLVVGVHNDKDVASYKRVPTLSMKERCTAASHIKMVAQVIPDAPLVLTKEFIEKHNIHRVGCSEEYDSKDDDYYRAAREMGILKVIPRVEGVSTSELMRRVKTKVI